MEKVLTTIGIIASVIAAIYAVRNDKAHIKSCIRKKKQKISDLQNQEVRKYGLNISRGAVTPEREKIEKIKKEIAKLEDRL